MHNPNSLRPELGHTIVCIRVSTLQSFPADCNAP